VHRALKMAAVMAAGALALAGCSSSSTPSPSTSASASSSPSSAIKVGMAYDIGGRGDKSFNDMAAAGLDKAAQQFGIQTKELQAVAGETDQQKAARLDLLASNGYNPVIAVGFAYAGAVKTEAAKFPAVNFAIIDDSSNAAPNVANLIFSANESSYLMGVLAATATKTGTVGFIGGVNVPLLQSFQAGFDQGVKDTKPSVKVIDKYLTQPPDFGGFNDPAKGKITAQGMFDAGADIVYAAAGGSGGGVFTAAKAAGKLAIGVDSDQYLSADPAVQSVILSSALKRVDTAVFNMIQSSVNGTPLVGVTLFDLKNNGVGAAESNAAYAPYKSAVDAAAQNIIAGTITVKNAL